MQPLPRLSAASFEQGGQSLVYEHPTRKELLVKLFTDPNHNRLPRTGRDAAHIESLNEFRNGITYSHRVLLSQNFSWPIEIYGTQTGVIDGIGILRAPEDFWIDVDLTTGKSKKFFLNLGFLTTDFLERPAIKSAPFRNVSFEDRVEVALEFLYSLGVLWEMGFRFCDFKEQNFSFTLTGRPRVFIIDAESVSLPNDSRIRSPGWAPPGNLGFSMESDRSLAFLLVWRILGKDAGSVPPNRGSGGYLDHLDKRTLRLLGDGYRDGTQAQIDHLVRALVPHRSADNIRNAFDWAVRTQLATLVMRYAPPNPTAQEAQILADARDQLDMEQELMALNPRQRQLRKNRSIPRPGFMFDIPDSVVLGAIDRDEEIIRQLALDGEFEEVAQAFSGRKSAAPVNQVATRAIQTAIAYLGPPPVRMRTTSFGEVRADWSWPGTDVVTGARIHLYAPDGALIQEGYYDRSKWNPSITITRNANVPNGSKLVVCYGMHFDDGVTVVCPLGAEAFVHGLQTPPRLSVEPPPTDPGTGWTPDSAATQPIVGAGSKVIVDSGNSTGAGSLGSATGGSGSHPGATRGGSTSNQGGIPGPMGGGGSGGRNGPPGPGQGGAIRRVLNGIGARLFGRRRP